MNLMWNYMNLMWNYVNFMWGKCEINKDFNETGK